MAWQVEDHDRYGSLPAWARETLADHAGDPREVVYERRELEEARTGDELWNAAQRELLRDGLGSRELALRLGGADSGWANAVWAIWGIGGSALILLFGATLFAASLGPARPF
jgi:hypothetical protein